MWSTSSRSPSKVKLATESRMSAAASASSSSRREACTASASVSPACSSFDFFKNFEERGNTFRVIVESLK